MQLDRWVLVPLFVGHVATSAWAEEASTSASVTYEKPTRLSLKIDASLGFPATGPQKDAFGVGGGAFIKGAYGPTDWLDLQLGVGGLAFNPDMDGDTPGLFGFGGGIRLQFPQERNRIAPFVEADPMFVRTGEYNRFGYSVATGILFAVDDPRTYWIGAHVKYIQVLQGEKAGFDTTDASLLMFGISTQFGVARQLDRDGDGVNDDKDKCVTIPGPSSNNGCPYLDSDGDSLNDDVDKCPLVVGAVENNGCPWPDSDKDGVLDKADKCPNEAGPAQNDGCPWPDSDKDSVIDTEDKCPTVPGLPQFGGCPDRDNDGVPEPPDLCPDKAGEADNEGCPRYKEIVVTSKAIELSQKIFFAYDKADILPKSYGLLDDVVQAFKDYPGLKVRIEGHTDSKGRLQHNMKLSQARADAVRKYVLAKGVSTDRITSATGYGPTQPLDTNKTAEGRERNRRVEFVVEGRGEDTLAPGTAPAPTPAPAPTK